MVAPGTYAGENNRAYIYLNNLNIIKDGDGEAIFDSRNEYRILTIFSPTINIDGLTFKNGETKWDDGDWNGGAIKFNNSITNSNINAKFIDNFAVMDGGAIYFNGDVINTNINIEAINNNVNNFAGTLFFNGKVNDVNITGKVMNSTIIWSSGGAVYFKDAVSNLIVNATFTGNVAEWLGGAIMFENNVTNVAIDGNYTNNKAQSGGAIYFNENVSNSTISGTYRNNTATDGGANYFNNDVTNVIISGTFTNNVAKNGRGGANYFNKKSSDVNIIGDYFNNSGNDGVAAYFNGEAENVSIVGCYINNRGNNVLYIQDSNPNNNIHDSIFINNAGMIIFVNSSNIGVVDTWFGNNASNYNETPANVGIDLDNWLFLNATAVPDELEIGSSSKIKFILQSYRNSEVSDHDASKMNVELDLTQTLGKLDKTAASIGEEISYTANADGNATVTGKFETVSYTLDLINTVPVIKISTKITASPLTTVYNANKYLIVTLKDANGKPVSGVKLTVNLKDAKTYNTDKNGQVKISTKGLAPKSYTAKITFNGNSKYNKSVKSVKITVKKATPKLTAKAKTFKTTTKTKNYAIVLKNNVNKAISKATVYFKVGGKTYKATTNSKGKATFKITKLSKKGTYKAAITYKGNTYYNKTTKKVTIKVKAVWKTVSRGSKAITTVKKIQKALKKNGYYVPYPVDGIYQKYTEAAVKQFQKAKGLKVTGKVDEKTAIKLKLI